MSIKTLWLSLLLAVVVGGTSMAQVRDNLVAPPLIAAVDAETPITLQSLAINTEVNGGLAQTTVDMVFHNPNARPLEGQLQFPLQAGQQVAGFALDIDGQMRPAVPVEKAKGQQVFESIERRQVDPALLQKTVGNHFKLRIFPIPPHGTRRVQLSYVETLQRNADGWRLTLPLDYARTLDSFPLRVSGGARPVAVDTFERVAFERDGNGFRTRTGRHQFGKTLSLQFAAAARPQVFTQGVDGEHYVLVEVPLKGASSPRVLPKVVGLLWDSSASARKRDIDGELAVLDRYLHAIGDAEVHLTRLRDVAEATTRFTVRGGDWTALRQALRETAYDGASALADWQPQDDVEEYLLVSDGLSNYGSERFPQLSQRQRLYTLSSAGAHADADRLAAWAEARGGRLVRWQGAAQIADATRQLLEEGPRLVSAEGVGIADVVSESPFPSADHLRIAGRLTSPEATLTLTLQVDGKPQTVALPVTADAPSSTMVAQLWAGYWLRDLNADAALNRARIRRLGQQFGMVTSETSLIVLDDINDYVRHAIVPPAAYRAEYARLRTQVDSKKAESGRAHLEAVVAEFQQKVAWWEKAWPKDTPVVGKNLGKQAHAESMATEAAVASSARMLAPPSPSPSASPPVVFDDPSPMDSIAPATSAASTGSEASTTLDSIEVTGSRLGTPEVGPAAGITLQAWKPDSSYARRLRQAPAEQVYAIYLDERESYDSSTAFYLDIADILLEHGQRALALRVLSNLAEMDLKNRHILRVLGYRLLQVDAPQLALPVFEQVRRLAEEEPQSFRDLGLAHAANGQFQSALDSLNEVVTREWDGRFDGVASIALNELNAIVVTSGATLDTRRIDPRLLKNLPLALRAVLSWDSDNSDMDLWVTDPNGEKCFYSNRATYQGGRMSNDFTGGYGPEEFVLRVAKPGKYTVEANFFGDRQQLVTGATTLQLHFSTGFGTSSQKDQRVTMRLNSAKETVLVGEFQVQ